MSWYLEHPERFPSELRSALPAAGTVIRGDYEILEPLYCTGTEVCFRALQLSSGRDCLLSELVPLRWCRVDSEGRFVPYSEESADLFERIRHETLHRLAMLQEFADEDAVPAVKDGFEALGTVWYVTRDDASPSLLTLLDQPLAPKDAIRHIAPILDALAGMHAAGLYHGAITPECIRVSEDGCILRGWLDLERLNGAAAADDLHAVSLLLFRMMTGEAFYSDAAAKQLPVPIRTAIYNGLYDPDMTVAGLWKALHAKKAVRRVQPEFLHTQHPSFLTRVFTPITTAAFCVCCLVTPALLWRVKVGELGSQPAAQTLDDVVYSLHDGEVQLPELLYLDQEEAVSQLEALGLNVILAGREDNPVIPENQVVMQSPDAGAVLHVGDTVSLTISDGWANFVPDVCGMTRGQAQETLEQLGFIVKFEEKTSPDDAPGTVIQQSTKPDVKLERDSLIKLTVSLGRDDLDVTQMEQVEDYVGTDFEKAKAELTAMHLYAMQAETVYDPEIPAGVIISQDIEPGKTVAQGTVIHMTVSKGVETVRVPDVTHASAENARALLKAARLTPVIVYVSNTEYAMDVVLSQSVAGGSLVAVGSEVYIETSIGAGSWVESHGGWSGNPLPTFETEPESTEESTEDLSDEPDTQVQTDPPESEEPAAPAVSETPELTDAPTTADEQELTAPPMPLE